MKNRSRSPSARATARRRSPAPPDRVQLRACCTLAEAGELKAALVALTPCAGPVTLAAGAVERIDTAALQVLAAFVRDRRLAGRSVHWDSPSTTLIAAARRLGLSTLLQLEGAGS